MFLVVFGSHFRDKCAVLICFYKEFVASGNSPHDPRLATRNEVRLGRSDPGFPRAGEQDDGSLPQTPSNNEGFRIAKYGG